MEEERENHVDDTAVPVDESEAATDTFGPSHRAQQDFTSVWQDLVEDLPSNEKAWLRASRPVGLHESTAIIAVADDFTRNQIEGRLRTRLEDSLSAEFSAQIRIAVTVDPELKRETTGIAPVSTLIDDLELRGRQ